MDIEAAEPGAAGAGLSIEALRRWLQATTGAAVELIETHISWVLLGNTHVWKVKKPVRTGFLDFTHMQTRRACCEEEVRLNRRMAPELYLGVVAIVGSARCPRIAGEPCEPLPIGDGDAADARDATDDVPGPVIDHAVLMRRFACGALFSERLAAGALDAATVGRFARRLAAFQREAARIDATMPWGTAERIRADTALALRGVAAAAPTAAPWVDALRTHFDAWEERLAPTFDERRRQGLVREGHGDLHLANVVVLESQVTAFDCIEFDPGLRWIDVQNDAAFLAMDLLAHGRADLAWGFIDDWLAALGDYEGVAVLRYYLTYRAVVRELVAALGRASAAGAVGVAGEPGRGTAVTTVDASAAAPAPAHGESGSSAPDPASAPPAALAANQRPDYAQLVDALLEPVRPRLLITHGVSGSGKSHVARALLGHAGAIRLRSDIERKRLQGLDALARSQSAPGEGLYAGTVTTQVYERLLALAALALDAGWPVIVDATFLRAADRDRFRRLAHEKEVPFAILDCRADEPVLRERVQARLDAGLDPSEADLAVLERQLAQREVLRGDEPAHALVVDTTHGPLDAAAIARAWR